MSEFTNGLDIKDYHDFQPLARLFDTIDFPLLRKQKVSLLEDINILESMAKRNMLPEDNQRRADDLTGILYLLDALQDAAVEAGIPEADVFGDLKQD